MKLLKYELLKILNNRLTIVLLLAFLSVNLSLFVWQSTVKYQYIIDSVEEYNRLEMQYRAMPFQEACEELAERAELLEFLLLLEAAQQDNYFTAIEEMTAEKPDFLETYSRMQEENTLPGAAERTAVWALHDQAVYMQGYQAYIEGMQEQADKMKTASVFNRPGTFSFRNIVRTPADFEHNKNLPLAFGQSVGLVMFSGFYPNDVFVLFLLLFISARLFWDEREKGLLILVKSGANGRLRTVLAKIATLLIVGSVVALVFYGVNMTAANLLFGFGDTSRYIQSMREFGGSNLLLTVRQYLVLFLLGKMFLICVFALLFSAAFSFFKNNAIAVSILLGLICGFYFAYRYIPALSALNPLKFLNPVAALNIKSVLSEYYNINLFGFPCNRVTALFVVMGALFLLSGAVVVFLYMIGSHIERQVKLPQKIGIFTQKILAKFQGVHLGWHEFGKLALSRKMLLFMIILLLGILGCIMTEEPVCSFDDMVYSSYLTELEGELTEEKEEYIAKEQERFQNLSIETEHLIQQFNTGKITKNRYDYEMFLIETFHKREIGFQKVLEQYNYIRTLQEEGIKAGFVNELSSDYIFNRSDRDTAQGILLLSLTAIVTAAAFCQEYKQGMIHIINPAKNGKGRLYSAKAEVAAGFTVCFMSVYIPQYINSYRFYKMGDLSLSIKNVRLFAGFPVDISILGYFIFSHMAQMVTILAALFFTVLISVKLKNQVTVMIVSLIFLTVPLVLFKCGIGFVKYLPFANAFVLNLAMRQHVGCIISGVSQALTLVLGFVFLRLSYLEFCNRRRKGNAS